MAERDPRAFESYPRRALSMQLDRRQMLTVFATELRLQATRQQGDDIFKLSDLGWLPDEQVEGLVPSVVPDCCIIERDQFVCAIIREGTAPVRLFLASSPAAAAFARVDGTTSLAGIARYLADEKSWDLLHAFGYVRGVFLHLVTLGVCRPG